MKTYPKHLAYKLLINYKGYRKGNIIRYDANSNLFYGNYSHRSKWSFIEYTLLNKPEIFKPYEKN